MRIEGYDVADEACRLLASAQASAEQGAAALAVAREMTSWQSRAAEDFRAASVEYAELAGRLVASCTSASLMIRWQAMVRAGGVGQEA